MGSWFKKLALGLHNNLLSPKKMGGAVREKPWDRGWGWCTSVLLATHDRMSQSRLFWKNKKRGEAFALPVGKLNNSRKLHFEKMF